MKKLTTLIVAFLFTAGMAFAQNNNEVTIDQFGDDHEATIDQMGVVNKAFVDQTDGSDRNSSSSGDAETMIRQEGDNNFANLRQSAFFANSYANIEQIGDDNRVEGQNVGDAFSQSNGGGIADITMNGNSNTLYSLRAEAQKNNNEFFLDITGNSNRVGILQEWAVGDVDIVGSNNIVRLDQQANANGNVLLFNEAKVEIVGDGTLDGNLNNVDIKQDGLSNYSKVFLRGDSNISKVTQTSDSNSAIVDVTGSGNMSNVTQTGNMSN